MDRWIYRITQSLRRAFPEGAVAPTARATGLVERSGAIDSVTFFWNLLIGATQPDSSVTKVNDLYETFTDHNTAYSSIQQWITPDLKQLLRQTFAHLSVEVGVTDHDLGWRFDRFRDVLIVDTTDCTLSPVSFDDFPGYSDDHAGARVVSAMFELSESVIQ